MHKVINGTKISFYDDSDNETMYIDYSSDECVWYFNSSEVATITEDSALFEPIKNIMLQQYEFDNNEVLHSYKDDNKLVWYSDCYYNPDDEWSINSVSCLAIEFIDGVYKLKCTKPLDEIIDRKNKTHGICFSPGGNGRYAKNIKTGKTLQDEFVINVYQKLLEKEKVKGLHRK